MGISADYILGDNADVAYRVVGNAVHAQVGRAILHAIGGGEVAPRQ